MSPAQSEPKHRGPLEPMQPELISVSVSFPHPAEFPKILARQL
jgi:hypothetical protein